MLNIKILTVSILAFVQLLLIPVCVVMNLQLHGVYPAALQ